MMSIGLEILLYMAYAPVNYLKQEMLNFFLQSPLPPPSLPVVFQCCVR